MNEPGRESWIGTPQGEQVSRTDDNGGEDMVTHLCIASLEFMYGDAVSQGYERLREATIRWAIVQQLKAPPPGFEVRKRV